MQIMEKNSCPAIKEPPKAVVITMGCSKNLMDSERLLKMLSDAGYDAIHDPVAIDTPVDCVIINTCGFIGDAKKESIDEILRCAQLKEQGVTKSLVVMGCLSERYREELKAELPEVDFWAGKTDWSSIISYLTGRRPATAPFDRIITTARHHAYLKISEGCDRFCAFCAIPLITGRHRSRPMEELIDEAKLLIDRGVKEINVIAQDLSSYGKDLYSQSKLAELTERISDLKGLEMIRLHYAYPADFPIDLLRVMRERPNVCKYLDIALQHISDKVLKNMRRHIDRRATIELIERIRQEVPDIHLRTTLMVGFPGESEKEFCELMEFVEKTRFERLGAFAYCEEEGTYAAKNFKDSVPEKTKQRRLSELMSLQESISQEIQDSKIGRTLPVIIDRIEDDYYVGRTQWDSPEVDPEVLVSKTTTLKIGDIVPVKIESALPFELIGKRVKEDIVI